jgi:hypothetical protein
MTPTHCPWCRTPVKDHGPEKESNCEWQSMRTDWRLLMLQHEVEHLPRTRAAIHNIRTMFRLELEARGHGAELTMNEAARDGVACDPPCQTT